jgi:hypothetical protein
MYRSTPFARFTSRTFSFQLLFQQRERIEELPEEDRKALNILIEGLLLRWQISIFQPAS